MGIALKQGRSNLLLIDGLYWLTLGSLLIILFYGVIMEMGMQQTLIIILKQGLNGLLNTLIAWTILALCQLTAAWVLLLSLNVDPMIRSSFRSPPPF